MEMSNPMSEWKFKRDTAFRKQFFVPDSFAHPAKMDAQLLIRIVETYTEPGETILDPMAGSGTTMLACMLGRNVILVELEEKFVKMCRDNWEQVRMRPQLGYTMGECVIMQGDARWLEGLLVDKCIFSPPFSPTKDYRGTRWDKWQRENKVKIGCALEGDYSENPDNIGNLPYGAIDKIVTSPPYAENPGTPSLGSVNKDNWGKEGKDIVARRGLERGYSKDTPNQIGNLPYGEIDKIITSPPFKTGVQPPNKKPSVDAKIASTGKTRARGYSSFGDIAQLGSDNPENIDNLPYGNIDSIITSPPYENAQATKDDDYVSRHTTGGQLATYHTSASNIGNLKIPI
jgi:DNA modification methylase